MTLQLGGIIPPLVTPFADDESVDEDAVRSEVRYHLDAGVHGVCMTGSTGEGASLSAAEAAAVVRAAVKEAAGAVPVIGGIICDSTREVVRYAHALREAGADALQITPVHYLFTPDADTTVAYYQQIAREVGLPVVIYNVVPWAMIPPAVLIRIFGEVSGVVAVKQSGGNMHAVADLLAAAPPTATVLTAIDDLLYPSFALGAKGAIAATLTVAPGLCVNLWDAVQAGDHARARDLHETLLRVWRSIEAPHMPALIKEALAMQGRSGGRPRSPMSPVTDGERQAIRSALSQAGILTG